MSFPLHGATMTMTMTMADRANDDGVMGPRGDRPKRRVFTAEHKAAIVAEYDAAEQGQHGQILRREGLYSSDVIERRVEDQPGPARHMRQRSLRSPRGDRRLTG